MMKRKCWYFSFILLVLLSIAAITVSYAWVNKTKKAKIEAEEVVVSETSQLLVSLKDDTTFAPTVNANDDKVSNYASALATMSLKDLTGDGLRLYSPIVDPYTKQPLTNGWSMIRNHADETSENIANGNTKANVNYIYLEIKFRSNTKMDVYLSKESFIQPSTKGLNENKECLLLRRTATKGENGVITYSYSTDKGPISFTSVSELLTVYNQSIYSGSFNDQIDTDAFNANQNLTENTQTIFSANYIAGAMRAAFIDDTLEGDYAEIANPGEGETVDSLYAQSKLRLVWAPNPTYQSISRYNEEDNSYTYKFDISDSEREENENSFYLCDSALNPNQNPSHFPDQIFVSDYNEGIDTVSNYHNGGNVIPHKLITLNPVTNDGKTEYEGLLKVVMWVEGTDPEANVSLSAGSSSENDGNGGAAKIAFNLSFFGVEVPE